MHPYTHTFNIQNGINVCVEQKWNGLWCVGSITHSFLLMLRLRYILVGSLSSSPILVLRTHLFRNNSYLDRIRHCNFVAAVTIATHLRVDCVLLLCFVRLVCSCRFHFFRGPALYCIRVLANR